MFQYFLDLHVLSMSHHTTNSEFEKNETPTTATTNKQNNNGDRMKNKSSGFDGEKHFEW